MAREGRPYGGASSDERRAERSARLLTAGVNLYGEQGFSAVGVKAICQHADLSERYFYEAFPNSEALLIASLQMVARLVFDALETAVEPARTPSERVDLACRAFFGLIRENPTEARLFLRGLDGVSPAVDAARIAVLADFVRFFDRITDQAASGSLLSSGVIGGVLQIALAWMHLDYRQSPDSVVTDANRLCAVALIRPKDKLQWVLSRKG